MARLLAFAGRPAAGKSTLARAAAASTGAMWLRIDSMDDAIWASQTAPADLRDWTYRAAQAVACDNLRLGRDVVADCVNDCHEARDGWTDAARRAPADLLFVEVFCSDADEHRRRLDRRSNDLPWLPHLTWEAVTTRRFDPWKGAHARVDTAGRSIDDSVAEILRLLAGP